MPNLVNQIARTRPVGPAPMIKTGTASSVRGNESQTLVGGLKSGLNILAATEYTTRGDGRMHRLSCARRSEVLERTDCRRSGLWQKLYHGGHGKKEQGHGGRSRSRRNFFGQQ